MSACEYGHVDVVQELLALSGDRRINVHAAAEQAFRSACKNGRLHVVRELLALELDRRIGVHVWDEVAFREACGGGHLDVARELLASDGDRRINVHAGSPDAFKWPCKCGHLAIVQGAAVCSGTRSQEARQMKQASSYEGNVLDVSAARDRNVHSDEDVLYDLAACPRRRQVHVHDPGGLWCLISPASRRATLVLWHHCTWRTPMHAIPRSGTVRVQLVFFCKGVLCPAPPARHSARCTPQLQNGSGAQVQAACLCAIILFSFGGFNNLV